MHKNVTINFVNKSSLIMAYQMRQTRKTILSRYIVHIFNRRTQSYSRKTVRASMSVEASLALPLFIFFIANLLSLFVMFEDYSHNLASLHDEVKNTAIVSHVAGEGGSENVVLTKIQPIKPLCTQIGFPTSYITVKACARKWTGYDVMSQENCEDEEEYVYITESGHVYHRSRDCSHLKVTVSVITDSQLAKKRNASGARYRKCEKCCKGSSTGGLLFITSQGDRYHISASCSALKRNIKTVPLSQVEGWPACSECGGK